MEVWECPNCHTHILLFSTKTRIYECDICSYKVPITDYKEAFYDLQKRFEKHRKDAMDGLFVFKRSLELTRKLLRAFIILSVVLAILCTLFLFK